MTLAVTGIADCRSSLGPSQQLRGYQLQPGTSDYPTGGYPINASQVDLVWLFGAWIMGVDYAGAVYSANFVLPAGSFGSTPKPSTSINLVVTGDGGGGNVFLAPTIASTNSALTSNVVTITVPNTFLPGQFVVCQGFANAGATALNGAILQVITASATQFTANFTHANITSGADTGTVQLLTVPGNGPVATGATSPITNSALTSEIVTMTVANNYLPGQFVVCQGLANALATAMNGVVLQVLTASATQFTAYFTHANITSGAETATSAQLISLGVGPLNVGAPAVVTNTVLTSDVATVSCVNNFTIGQIVVCQGLTNGATLNGISLAVISTGLTAAKFEANVQIGNISTGADAGTASPMIAPTSPTDVEIPAGTNLSGVTWFGEFLGW